jgi:subtilase family serine protease
MVASRRISFVITALCVLVPSIRPQLLAQSSDIVAVPPIRVYRSAENSVIGFVPSQVRQAYGFDQVSNQGAGQTIAIVVAFDNPTIEKDLGIFNATFGLPACTTNNGCFQTIQANGPPNCGTGPGSPPPTKKCGGDKQLWPLEIALDVEWAHAMAPDARLILVEAKSNILSDLLQAVDVAGQSGASVVSMSWGGPEFEGETEFDNHFVASNVTFFASTGDSGNPSGLYPAASPNVTAVGGTTLNLSHNGAYSSEVAWSGSGGGISLHEVEPPYQASFRGVGIPFNPGRMRGVPDVAYNAGPTGFAVYTKTNPGGPNGWIEVIGTSGGPPQWSALIAIVNSLRAAAGKPLLSGVNPNLYTIASTDAAYASNFHDIVEGSNGSCGIICMAFVGYDYVTGLGSPQANSLIKALVDLP